MVEDISEKIKRCTDIVNELAKKAYGFVVIDVNAASKLRDRIGRVTSALKPFCNFFQRAVEENAPTVDSDLEDCRLAEHETLRLASSDAND
ncbi:hypothetical protein Esti_006485 [Eimeria stiedai]